MNSKDSEDKDAGDKGKKDEADDLSQNGDIKAQTAQSK
jgi:hypothetical protein